MSTASTSAPLHPEAGNMASGAFVLGAGHLLNALAGILSAIVVPRLFGPSNFGEWVLFRGVISLLVAFCAVGEQEIMACFYIPRKAAGDVVGAGQIFKALTAVRLLFSLAAGCAGYFMLVQSSSALAGSGNGLLLACSVLVRGLMTSFIVLLFGERRMKAVAGMNLLQAVTLPLCIMAGYAVAGLSAVPWASLASDLACLLAALALSQPARYWVKGCLPLAELGGLLKFALGMVSAGTLMTVFMNSLPYLMNVRGYGAEAIGFVGLGYRCGMTVFSGLIAMATATLPTLSLVIKTDGLEKAFSWQRLATRLGALLFLLVSGASLAVLPGWASAIWGTAYARVAPVIGLSVAAFVPFWVGSQMIRMRLLQQAPRLYFFCALAYGAVLSGGIFGLPVDEMGFMAVMVLTAASMGVMLISVAAQARLARPFRALRPFILPLAAWGLAWWIPAGGPLGRAILWGAGWIGLFLAAAWLGRGLQFYELRDMWTVLLKKPKGSVDAGVREP